MKLITAIIKPSALDDVRANLTELGIQGMTVSEVRGYGRQKGHTELYRGAEYNIQFVPKVSVEIAIRADQCDDVIQAITQAANSNTVGDGKIFVREIENVVRIRTRETDHDAL